MNISELIARYGEDRLQWQNLDHCITAMNRGKKKGTTITFGTEQNFTLKGTEQIGMILWFDRQAVADIMASNRSSKGTAPAVEPQPSEDRHD